MLAVAIGIVIVAVREAADPSRMLGDFLDVAAKIEAGDNMSYARGSDLILLFLVFIVLFVGDPIMRFVDFLLALLCKWFGLPRHRPVKEQPVSVVGKAFALTAIWAISVSIVNLA